MSEPAGWRVGTLSDVAHVNPESVQISTERDWRFRYIDLSSAKTGHINWGDVPELTFAHAPSRARRMVARADVLFGTVRPVLQSHGFIPASEGEPLVASTGFAVLRARSGTDPRFLFHLAMSRIVLAEALQFEVGSNYPAVNESDVRRFAIMIPPLAEQGQIGEILDAADEEVRCTEQLIAKLEQAKQGILHDLLTCGIDKDGHLRDPHRHPEDFWNSALGLIPADWRVASCDELCEHIVVGIVIKPTQYYIAEGVPILRSANVREGGIDMSDLKFMSRQSHELLRKSSVRPGDVLTVRTGYPGTSAVITDDIGDANCVDIIISRPNGAVNSNFLALWVNSPFGKGQVLAGQGGLAQQHFNIGQMKKLLVGVPSPGEQRVITEIVSSWEARVRAEIENLEKLRVMKQGLMDNLLTGRVRVGASA